MMTETEKVLVKMTVALTEKVYAHAEIQAQLVKLVSALMPDDARTRGMLDAVARSESRADQTLAELEALKASLMR